jgi:methionine synthase II (cobalamin-independent)
MDSKLRELVEIRSHANAAFRKAKDSYHRGEISVEEYEQAEQEKLRAVIAVEKYTGAR